MNMRQILLAGSAVTILSSAALGHAQASSHKSAPTVTTMASTATMATVTSLAAPQVQPTGQASTSQLAQPRTLEHSAITSASALADGKTGYSRSVAVPAALPATARPDAAPATSRPVKPKTPVAAHATQSAKAQLSAHAPLPVSKAATARTTQTSRQTSDLYWLARAVEAEAGGESMAVKIAVADVILNRVRSTLYPNSIQQVIFQQVSGHYAFTSVANGWIYHQPSTASVNAAREALLAGKNIVPSALVFYNNSQTPAQSWVRTRPVISTLGSLTFAQ